MNSKQTKSIQQPWLSLVRLAWVVFTMNNVLPTLFGLPAYYRELLALNPPPNMAGWTQATYSAAAAQAGLPSQVVTWMVLMPTLVKTLVFLSIGLFILWRKSDEWLGLLGSYVLVGLCGTFFGDRFQFANSLPVFWSTVAEEAGVAGWLAFYMFLLIFPNGRFKPRWTRWLGISLGLWFVATELPSQITGTTPDWIIWIGVLLISLTLVGQVQRYRRFSSPAERLQMRWFISAIGTFFIYITLHTLFIRIFPLPASPGILDLYGFLALNLISDLVFTTIPLAIAIAIFRYRLWDIDLVIRRTLQYGLLSLVLGLVYFGGVTLLQQVFTSLAGQQSPLAVVLSTLVIAVLFTPLRRALQTLIDRRFYRRKYDAEAVVVNFTNTARNEMAVATLGESLVQTARETLEPQSISLWLAQQEEKR